MTVHLNGLTMPNPFVIGSGKDLQACRERCSSSLWQTLCLNIAVSLLKSMTLVATGPPGTNYAVMKKAFEEGWGGVIAKTVSVDSSKVRHQHSIVSAVAQSFLQWHLTSTTSGVAGDECDSSICQAAIK